MSFGLYLEVRGLTDEQGRQIERQVRMRDLWPVRFEPAHRRRLAMFGRREVGPRLWVLDANEEGIRLLSDDAEWDAAAWAMTPEVLPALEGTIRVLGEVLSQGFGFRATWVGSPVEREVALSAEDLAGIARASQLNEFTLYRVPPAPRERV